MNNDVVQVAWRRDGPRSLAGIGIGVACLAVPVVFVAVATVTTRRRSPRRA